MHPHKIPFVIYLDDFIHKDSIRIGVRAPGILLVIRIPPSPGHREPRYAHLLCGDVEVEEDELPTPTHRTPSVERDAHVASLDEKVEALQGEIQELREMFEAFRKQFE